MPEAVIVATARSPDRPRLQGLAHVDLRPDDLTAQIVRAALDKVPQLDPADIDDLMLGCGLPGGEQGFNMARVVAVLLGYDNLPGTTVTRYCSSSLQTTRMAFHAIKAGEGDVFISAGVECVSRFAKGSSDGWPDTQQPGVRRRRGPHRGAGRGRRRRSGTTRARTAPLPDVYIAMGQTAENVAQLRGITREDQDEFGVRSQNLAEKAHRQRLLGARDHPGHAAGRHRGERRRRPARRGHPGGGGQRSSRCSGRTGPVTAGNCCPLNDGAAAVVIMSDTQGAPSSGITPLARIVSTGVTGAVARRSWASGPVEASRQALARAGMTIDDIDLVEINEAFAAQVIPSYRELGIDLDKLNVNGGAIAVGHPFGMTGARITTTLINCLQFHDKTVRPGDDVRRRRPGHGDGPRAALLNDRQPR